MDTVPANGAMLSADTVLKTVLGALNKRLDCKRVSVHWRKSETKGKRVCLVLKSTAGFFFSSMLFPSRFIPAVMDIYNHIAFHFSYILCLSPTPKSFSLPLFPRILLSSVLNFLKGKGTCREVRTLSSERDFGGHTWERGEGVCGCEG